MPSYDAQNTFRYLHYGNGIADFHGVSLLGKSTTFFSNYIGTFLHAVYLAVIERREPVLAIHAPAKAVFARSWNRLIVPLCDVNGRITQFAVINIPDNELRAGLEIVPDPVLILDSNQIVRFANRPARELFGRQIYQGSKMDLFTFAGIDVEMPASPWEMAASKTVHDVVSLAIADTMIERFNLTISGTVQWGTAFYVITVHPAIEQK